MDSARPTIGFLSPLVHGYYWGSLLTGIVKVSRRTGCRVAAIQTIDAGLQLHPLVRNARADQPKPYTLPVGWDTIDAFVIAQDAVPDAYVHELHARGKPIVLISREVDGLTLPRVVPDNRGGIAAAIEHLVTHGHRRIMFGPGNPDGADDSTRLAAYRTEMLARGLRPYEPAEHQYAGEEMSGYRTADQLLSEPERPTAVVACTDVVAIAVMHALGKAGISVPEDVAVIGFDDIDDAAAHQPPLSTVAQSFDGVGSLAADLVISQLRGHQVPAEHHYAPVTLVVRRSCGCREERIAVRSEVGSDARDKLVSELTACGADDLASSRIRPSDISELADDVVTLFDDLARTPPTAAHGGENPGQDRSGRIRDVADHVRRLLRRKETVPAIAKALRMFAKSYAHDVEATETPGTAPGAVATAGAVGTTAGAVGTVELGRGVLRGSVCERMADLVYDLAVAIAERHLGSKQAEYLYFHQQRKHYEISTNLLRRDTRDSRSLAWLDQTEVTAGCLAIWDEERGRLPDQTTLRVIGSYSEGDGFDAVGQQIDIRSFPSQTFVDLARDDPADIVYLLPVSFDGSDWGVLALIGALEMREQTATEMFNHWAVMLTVALDQQQTVRSLFNQQQDLLAGYERERALTEEIRVSEERYALAADAANDGLWDWDVPGATVFYSTRWKSMLGYADDEIGSTVDAWFSRVHPDDQPTLNQRVTEQLVGGSAPLEVEYRMLASDGTYRWMLTRARSVHDDGGRTTRLVGSMTDVTDRRLLEEQLRHEALYDGLTGLPSRTLFRDRLNQAMERASRREDFSFAVVFLDLDGFKLINDSLGHHAGDEVLKIVAERLSRQMRANDTVSRFGGDEFVLLLNDVHDVTDLPVIVKRIIAELSRSMMINGQVVAVSAAAGIAVGTSGHDDADRLLRNADTAMYQAKAAGKGSSVMFDESMRADAAARIMVAADVVDALAKDQLELYYQPILDLRSRRTTGVEALIRWRHPSRGLLPPAEFLPAVESTGTTVELSHWTIRQACAQLGRWRREFPTHAGLTVAVNLSDRQFWDSALPATIRRALAECDLPASALILEITENVIMDDLDSAERVMHALRADGVRLHLDDFGTGRSSLEAIGRLPIDAIKIDKSFLASSDTSTRSKELIRIMISMGRSLGIDVIAEGVERTSHEAMVISYGGPQAQGYAYSRPVSASEVSTLLAAELSTITQVA